MKLDVPQTEELTEVATPSMEHIDPPMKSTSCRPGRTTPTLQWQTASSHSLSAKLPWHKVRSAEPHVSPSARRCPLMRFYGSPASRTRLLVGGSGSVEPTSGPANPPIAGPVPARVRMLCFPRGPSRKSRASDRHVGGRSHVGVGLRSRGRMGDLGRGGATRVRRGCHYQEIHSRRGFQSIPQFSIVAQRGEEPCFRALYSPPPYHRPTALGMSSPFAGTRANRGGVPPPVSGTMNPGETTPPSPLDKPLAELTEEDIAQLTREDCRRFLKAKGMRRPSWNKSQAIQQVISLKALLEGRPGCDDGPAGGGIVQKLLTSSPSEPLSPPQVVRFSLSTLVYYLCTSALLFNLHLLLLSPGLTSSRAHGGGQRFAAAGEGAVAVSKEGPDPTALFSRKPDVPDPDCRS
ncbi:hypothetical protein GW17_00024909 [Ensete ventricosum]|nr:hypothetical protein GW17_00024909 [Ensete ventricosum]